MTSIKRPKLIQNDTFLSGGVETPGIPASEVLTLSGSAIAKNVGDADFAATYTVIDANGITRTGMKLRSSDRKVVRVNADGTLRVVGGGSCTLELDSGAGSGTIAVTIAGATYTGEDPDSGVFVYGSNAATVYTPDAIVALLGGNAVVLADWHVNYGLTGGATPTQLDDRRGVAGFGPSLTTGGTVTRVGSSTADYRIKTNGVNGFLTTGYLSLFDLSTPKTVIYFGTLGIAVATAQVLGLESASFTNWLPFYRSSGRIAVLHNPGANQRLTTPVSAKRKLYIMGTSGAGADYLAASPMAVASQAGSVKTSLTSRMRIGDSGGGFTNEEWRQILVLNVAPSALSTATLKALESYAYTEHACVTGSLKHVVFEGDSLVYGEGLNGDEGFPFQAMERPSLAAIDYSVTAVSLSELRSGGTRSLIDNAAATDDVMVRTTRSKNALVVLVGTNDITSGRNAAQILGDMASYYTARKSAGFGPIVLCTLIARNAGGGQANFDTQRAAINAALRAASPGTYFDALADTGAIAEMDTTADTANATYYQGDLTHLTAAGCAKVADLVETTLLAAL
jgi:hypothetical protein